MYMIVGGSQAAASISTLRRGGGNFRFLSSHGARQARSLDGIGHHQVVRDEGPFYPVEGDELLALACARLTTIASSATLSRSNA